MHGSVEHVLPRVHDNDGCAELDGRKSIPVDKARDGQFPRGESWSPGRLSCEKRNWLQQRGVFATEEHRGKCRVCGGHV